jgi:hypothetical protein
MRRVCATCTRIVKIVDVSAGQIGFQGLVDIFKAEELTQEQVDRVFDAQVGSTPTIRDRLTSQMTNALMRGLGMPGRQSPQDVMKVRETMNGSAAHDRWGIGDKPPTEID